MFNYRKFDVEISRKVDRSSLSWPAKDEAGHDSGLGGNRQYNDLRRASWVESRKVFDLESELISRLENAPDWEEECDLIDDELYESDEHLFGLDLGVAAAVAALSASGCIPCSSCNAGAFGGDHQEVYPLVAFFVRVQALPLIEEAADAGGLGLENGPGGCVVAYADDVRRMRVFATELMRRKPSFRGLRMKKRAKGPRGPKAKQLDLDL